MNEKNPNLVTKKGGARRKLVRGAFAAPAMLALHSGGALASTSLGACLVKSNKVNATQTVSSGDDLWFRYNLYGYVKSGAVHGQSGYWIQGADLLVYVRDSQIPWFSSGYQRYDVSNDILDGTPVAVMPSGPGGFSWDRTGQWVSLRVSSSGQLVGAGKTGEGGSAVRDSCWNSFAAAPRP